MIKKLADALKKGEVCMTFLPIEEKWAEMASKPGFSDPTNSIRVKLQTDTWGTKWDFGDDVEFTVSRNTLSIGFFETAWSPPIGLYNELVKQGFKVQASYFEPGCAFYGSYGNGVDECANFDDYSEIPNDIRETFQTDEFRCDEDMEEEGL